jgi:hypothetical protein
MASMRDYDWAVTVLFYAALHLTQAYLQRSEISAENHRQRDQEIRSSEELRPILDPYRALKAHSENARYRCRAFSREEFDSILNGVFDTVVAHLNSLLEKDDHESDA